MNSRVLQYCYLIQEGLELDEVKPRFKEDDQGPVHFHSLENISVIVMELLTPWEEGLSLFHQRLTLLKQELQEHFLASVFVLVSSHNDWNRGLREAEAVSGRPSVMEFKVSGGKVARLGWRWPEGQAYYFYQADKGGGLAEDDRDFLTRELPLLDARLAKIDHLAFYYREQRETVQKEKRELDARLSQILYSQFGLQRSDQETLEAMEQSVNSLSTAYGMQAGNYRLVREGRLLLEEQVEGFREQVRNLKRVRFDREAVGRILGYYKQELSKIMNLETDLQTTGQNIQAGIDMVRSRIEILMSRKSLELQRRSLVFQVAAGSIEFIVVAYYTMSLWKTVAQIKPWIILVFALIFAGEVVYTTHVLAEKIQGEKVPRHKFYASFGVVLLTLLAMVGLSIL